MNQPYMMPDTVSVLDIPLFDGSIKDAYASMVPVIKSRRRNNLCISATGAHGMVIAQKDLAFKQTLQNFNINLPDGVPGVWVGRLKGSKRIERCYGPDFFEYFIKQSASENINHFFCGGKEGVAHQLKSVCEEKFQNGMIKGVYCPPFRQMTHSEFEELGTMINDLDIDVVWIGISTPKQEMFAMKLAQYVDVAYIVTVGAAFDFHIGNVKQAPKLMQKNGLEWLFRLYTEPKRLWKRYVTVVPLFIYYNLKNLLFN